MTSYADQAADRLDYAEAASYLRVSPRTVRRLVLAEQLPEMRLRGRVFFTKTDLDELLAKAKADAA